MKYINILLLVLLLGSCNNEKDRKSNDDDATYTPASTGIPAPKSINYNIISEFSRDTASFTEGLELHNGRLYESGGEYGHSLLQFSNPGNGAIAEKAKLEDKYFGEGITILKDKLYQLTYQENVGFVYDISNIQKPLKTFTWPYEGWGMTNNGTDLIIDAGGATLYFVDPETFKIKTSLPVSDDRGPVNEINELEYIDGFIWANVWNTNRIVKIDPETGHVVGDMYLDKIASREGKFLGKAFPNTDVLNGIAWDSTKKSMYITGKRWPKLYEVKL
ncbi:MAG: glutaminyl-peptide cyclotransferase [Bacteroidetes bacterium]|nr:glutaminyl-peptide cyclotransferase [Bacteroidota bacterium]